MVTMKKEGKITEIQSTAGSAGLFGASSEFSPAKDNGENKGAAEDAEASEVDGGTKGSTEKPLEPSGVTVTGSHENRGGKGGELRKAPNRRPFTRNTSFIAQNYKTEVTIVCTGPYNKHFFVCRSADRTGKLGAVSMTPAASSPMEFTNFVRATTA
jgi:hypothetical protein